MLGLRSPAFRLFAGLLFVMALLSLTLRYQPSIGQFAQDRTDRIKQESPQEQYQRQRQEQQLRELQQQKKQEQQELLDQRRQQQQDQQRQPELHPVPTGSFKVCMRVWMI